MKQGNRVAIVTGSSRGLGAEVALRLAKDGFDVTINYIGKCDKADRIVKKIKTLGRSAIAVQADISCAAEVKHLFEQTIGHFGRIDAVVNNAAIFSLSRIVDGDLECFDRITSVNLRGSFLVMSHAARHVVTGGRIVVFSSSVVSKASPTYGPYIASKAGVEGLVPVLANELRGRYITVNAVAPGPVATELFLGGENAELLEPFRRGSQLERLGQPNDIAGTVSFLLGPDAGWINAQVLRVNGGFN